MKSPVTLLVVFFSAAMCTAAAPVTFNTRTAHSGKWSDAATWENGRKPQANDIVQIRAGHVVTYDVKSNDTIRMIHVAGTLSFSRDQSTLLDVGLIKVEPGNTTTEDGFDCHAAFAAPAKGGQIPVLELGTPESPIPASVTATIRLRHHPGMNPQTLPAIVVCGSRWDVHGAPLARTWTRLATSAMPGAGQVTLDTPVKDWRAGDHIIVTTGEGQGPETGHSFQKRKFGRQKPVGTEERKVVNVGGQDSATLELDRPLDRPHQVDGIVRCEVANLSRNVVIESADPAGVRGHTMYHLGSSGGISYAEFRHLGKEGVLGKYAIHFHLVRDTMRGSGVVGASIWDSHNRWITIHGTDHLLVRDCVGYQSIGHGFFLEDATEQWNVLDRNLAVQSFSSAALPNQVLPYDPNDGAGFWWANANNTLTRNVACENDHYGYHFQVLKSGSFNPVLELRGSDGNLTARDVRTIPFLRFEDNESHGDGLYGFRFGDEEHGSVHGTRAQPFIARKLRVWNSHYAVRPNVKCFLLDQMLVRNSSFGLYHPDYDTHVYRNLELDNVTSEPLNGGHDEESFPEGSFTFDRLTLKNCQLSGDPLIQLTGNATGPGVSGHFRGVTLANSKSSMRGTIDFGGGPRTYRTDSPISYFFHDVPDHGDLQIGSVAFVSVAQNAEYRPLAGWTGADARAAAMKEIAFPELLSPADVDPPASLITQVSRDGSQREVRGVSHDNGEVAAVVVNGQPATIISQHAGVADWRITLELPADGRLVATAVDRVGNRETMPHELLARSE